MSTANENRNWQIYADCTWILIREAQQLYAGGSDSKIDISNPVFAIDASTIESIPSIAIKDFLFVCGWQATKETKKTDSKTPPLYQVGHRRKAALDNFLFIFDNHAEGKRRHIQEPAFVKTDINIFPLYAKTGSG